MSRRRIAWTIQRLLIGHDLNGELTELPEPYRGMADHLARVPVDDSLTGSARREALAAARAPLWDAMVTTLSDRDDLIRAVVDADPDGPTPDPEADGPPDRLEWPEEPKPVRDDLRPVPALEPGMIPGPVRKWLADIAARVSCPLGFPAIAAVVALSIVLGRKVAIRPKRHDDWTVVANLWGAIIGRPGVMKTPALTEATKPLRRLEAEARKHHEAARQAYEAACLVAAAQAAAAKDAMKAAAKKGTPKAELDALARDALKASLPAEPILRRYTSSDPTVEALGDLLRDNPAGIGIIRDELTGWMRSLDKAGRECDRAFYLEGWNGGGMGFQYDRIGRGNILIPNPCVSILGGMQPGPLRSLLRGVARGDDADDGLISRFQLLVWPETSARWRNVDRWPDTAEKNRAFAIFRFLDELDPADIDATPDEDDGPPFLRFEHEAQECFDSWRDVLENQKLRTPDESPLVESHLSKYRSLMPSLALLFHLIDVADGAGVSPVGFAPPSWPSVGAITWNRTPGGSMRAWRTRTWNRPAPCRRRSRPALCRVRSPTATCTDIAGRTWTRPTPPAAPWRSWNPSGGFGSWKTATPGARLGRTSTSIRPCPASHPMILENVPLGN